MLRVSIFPWVSFSWWTVKVILLISCWKFKLVFWTDYTAYLIGKIILTGFYNWIKSILQYLKMFIDCSIIILYELLLRNLWPVYVPPPSNTMSYVFIKSGLKMYWFCLIRWKLLIIMLHMCILSKISWKCSKNSNSSCLKSNNKKETL